MAANLSNYQFTSSQYAWVLPKGKGFYQGLTCFRQPEAYPRVRRRKWSCRARVNLFSMASQNAC